MPVKVEEKSSALFHKTLESQAHKGLIHFKKILHSYVVFHASFSLLFFLEGIFLISLYSMQTMSVLFAFGLFAFVLTLFTYLVLIFYFQTKKPEQLRQLKEWYLSTCKKSFPQDAFTETEFHLYLAQALHYFSSMFQPKELPTYFSSVPIPSLKRVIKKFSHFCAWRDFQKMKELLLLDCIYQHLCILKHEPTNLEIHASLGNSYLTLSSIYKMMNKDILLKDMMIILEDFEEELLQKFKTCVLKAIEEYKIILATNEQNPWALAQLATCYHELEMYEKEIETFEKILETSCSQEEVMARLSYLYFQEGKNAKGFKLYQLIKETNPARAEEIFNYYIHKAQEETAL
jgi:tetratricopeptide (TPR) repeat protein